MAWLGPCYQRRVRSTSCPPRAGRSFPFKVKRFAEPLRCYKVLGLYDDLVREGSVIREEQDGFKVLLDLKKRERAEAIEALRAMIDRLKP